MRSGSPPRRQEGGSGHRGAPALPVCQLIQSRLE